MKKVGWLHVFILGLNDTTLIVYLNTLTWTDFNRTFWWDFTQVGMIRVAFWHKTANMSEYCQQPLKAFDLNPEYTWLLGLIYLFNIKKQLNVQSAALKISISLHSKAIIKGAATVHTLTHRNTVYMYSIYTVHGHYSHSSGWLYALPFQTQSH